MIVQIRLLPFSILGNHYHVDLFASDKVDVEILFLSNVNWLFYSELSAADLSMSLDILM